MRKIRCPALLWPALLWLAACLGPAPARADLPAALASPGLACRHAIDVVERQAGIPARLMAAIGLVESGRPDAITGSTLPWPWTIDVGGRGQFFDSREAAIAAVRKLQAQGVRSIDVGCMQVNLMHHPAAFATLDQAFDPLANAGYAARFLVQLHALAGDWRQATALYHSATPALGAAYRSRVMAVWPQEQLRGLAGQGLYPLPTRPLLLPHPVLGRDGLIVPSRRLAANGEALSLGRGR